VTPAPGAESAPEASCDKGFEVTSNEYWAECLAGGDSLYAAIVDDDIAVTVGWDNSAPRRRATRQDHDRRPQTLDRFLRADKAYGSLAPT